MFSLKPMLIVWIFHLVSKVYNYKDLDVNNFNETITSNVFSLVVFYTKYDKNSKKHSGLINELPDDYYSNNQRIKITFCRLDVYDNISIQSLYDVKYFPKFFLFFGSTDRYLEYDPKSSSSNYEKQKIIRWIILQTKFLFEEISYDKLKEIEKNNITKVVFFGSKSTEEFKIYDFITKKLSILDVRYYFISQDKSSDLLIYRGNEKIEFSRKSLFNEDNVFKFLSIQTKDRISEVDQIFIEHTFRDKYPSLIFYFNSNRDTVEKGSFYYDLLLNFQRKYEGKLTFGYGTMKQSIIVNLAISLGILKIINNASPVIFLHDTRNLLLKNFIFNNTLTNENLEIFLKNWENNSNEGRFLKSSETKNEDNQTVNEVSGYKLREMIKDQQKNLVILFYDPYCRNCSKFYNTFEDVSLKYKSNMNLIFLKINMMKNDVVFIEIDKLPLIALSPNIGSLKIYEREMTIKNFSEFIEESVYKLDL